MCKQVAAGARREEIADALLVGAKERVDLLDAVNVKAGGADQDGVRKVPMLVCVTIAPNESSDIVMLLG